MNKSVRQRLLATLMVALLAISMVPTWAFAEVSDVTRGGQDSQAGSDLVSPGDGSDASSGAIGVGVDGDEDASSGDFPDASPLSVESAGSFADSGVDPQAGNVQAVSSDGDSDSSLTSSAKVYIQDAKDKDSSYSNLYGALAVGTVLWANMYDTPEGSYWASSVGNPGTWEYEWRAGSSKSDEPSDYTEVVGHEQQLCVTEKMAGKYFICKVTADGKDYYGPASSYDGSLNVNYVPGPVLAPGQASLHSVKLSSATPSVGDVLAAEAYTSYSSPVTSDVDVTFTWQKATSQYGSYSAIEGESGKSLTLTEDLARCFIKVTASAGVNTVEAKTSSAVKLAGQIDIYSAVLANASSGESGYVYTVEDTVRALAKEKGASDYVAEDKLNYQWQVADTKDGAYSDIEGATGSTLSLTSYEGKSVCCILSSKIGASSYTTKATSLVGAAGSVNITSVSFSKSGKVNVGDSLTATAKASGVDVSDSEKVRWQWYWGDTSTVSKCTNAIEGATGRSFDVSGDYQGKYLVARADGGFGETGPYSAVGPVVVPGMVTLYGVTVEGAAKVGNTLTAKATKNNSYTSVAAGDIVSYQWQCADTKSSYDSAFSDIAGATSAELVLTDELVGKYIRVVATSENKLASTQKKGSYGGYQSVDPTGPVTLAGQYNLKSLEIKDASSFALQVGQVLVPAVKIQGDYSSWAKDLPSDAKLELHWYAGDGSAANWQEVNSGVDEETGALTIDTSLLGKKLRVTACALDNTVEWVSPSAVTEEGVYSLLRVTTNPSALTSSTQLITGDAVSALAQASSADGNTYYGIDVTSEVSVDWYAANSLDGEYEKVSDVSGSSIVIPESLAGKYLKVVAASGTSSLEAKFENPIIDGQSLQALVQRMSDNYNWAPALEYGDENLNDVFSWAVSEYYGFDDVSFSVKEVSFTYSDENASAGISSADDETNGDITCFFIDPNEYSGYNIDSLRNATVTLVLKRGGEAAEYTTPKVTIPWDESRLKDLLDSAAASAQIEFAEDDSADSVTQNIVTLPYRAGERNKIELDWTSSDLDSLVVWPKGGGAWGTGDFYGKAIRKSSDCTVTLTAKASLVSGDVDVKGTHEFSITVKSDPEKVAAAKKELQEKVDEAFVGDRIVYSDTGTIADMDGLNADIRMPRPAEIGLDGKDYSVSYSASNDSVVFNGYKGVVYRPQPGELSRTVQLTVTVKDKNNSDVSATKTLDYTITPLDQADIDAELELMAQAKAGYAVAILDGQDANAVSSNLHAFQKAYMDENGKLAWSYNRSTTDSTAPGIVPVDLPGYDAMSSAGWRVFKSSRASVISHENLLVTQPEYNTEVTVSSSLSSEKYARYAERYPESETYAALANQPVSATVKVIGTSGADDPDAGKYVTAMVRVVGLTEKDAEGNASEFDIVPLAEVSIPADEDVLAETILEEALLKAGCTDLQTNAYGLTSLTLPAPDGRTLDSSFSEPYRYWSFYVNGTYSMSDSALSYVVKKGDTVEYRYLDAGVQVQPSGNVTVNPGAEHPDLGVEWNGFNNAGFGVTGSESAPIDAASVESWAYSLLSEEDRAAGKDAYASEPLVAGGKAYIVTATSFYDPDNGWALSKGIARLLCIDPATGTVEAEVQLGATMDSTCRPVYADGIIVVPLAGGFVQAVSASTLETLWFAPAFANQLLSTLTINDGYVYVAALDRFGEGPNRNDVQSGTVKRFNLRTGAEAGSASSSDGGYYWSGGVMVNGYYVIGSDFDQVRVYSADLSEKKGSLSLGANVRSSLVVHEGFVYAVTANGELHKLSVGSDGSVSEVSKVSFAASSTSTPAFSGDYAFIGGAVKVGGNGMLAVVDLRDMSVQQVTQADGVDLIKESKSTPLVLSRGGETYVYFTCNGAPLDQYPNYQSGGGVFLYKLGDEQATELFAPGVGYANFCMASVACDAAGNLYYTNDSGHLFCIKAQPAGAGDEGGEGSGGEGGEGEGDGAGGGAAAGGSGAGAAGSAGAAGGTVAPSSVPVAAGAAAGEASEGAEAEAEAEDEAKAGAAADEASQLSLGSAADGARSVAGADDAGEHGASTWPYVVLGVGVIAAVAAIAWFIAASRRRGSGVE